MLRTECTVLVVDDAPEDRTLYRRYLERSEECRYTVLEVDRGEHALAAFRERRPDCVLLDYLMPDKDGLAVLHELTREAAGESAAVIMLTGSARDQVGVQALKAGALDYLDKNSITAEQLHRAIQYALKKVDLKRAVEQQRQWLQGTLDSIGEAVIATDGGGRVMFMNPVAEVLLDARIRTARGRAIEEICSILDEHTHRALGSSFIELALRSEIQSENYALLVTRSGKELPVEYRLVPIRDEKGEVQGAVVALRDISGRRRIEASLREREERLALVTRAASDAMWDWDLRADHVWWNEAYEALFGRPPQRTGHAPQWRLERVHAEDRSRVAQQIHGAMHGPDAKWVLDYRARTLGGAYRRFVERAVIVRDGDGRAVRVLALMLDISDWTRSEDEARPEEGRRLG
ncbi:histidine kinase [Sulfurifustis variabilis]|uniref:Histidine kinase n=1 Tax=Sulfurifustis variabilis TaxID=1675686 RepID=A0A1B4V6B5_9GAMM|nr:response regulator [Sulfurifustis variabilis]BAU49079.1 histidine kinase [Sulfurifustis variabilis]